MSRTYVVTGAASGIGRATANLLAHRGNRVIGVDVRSGDVVADLSTPQGREDAVEGVLDEAGGRIDGVVANAGLSLPTAATVAVNYFGAVGLLHGLRSALVAASSGAPRAVVTSSMATLMPVHAPLVEACVAGDEERAMLIAADLEAQGPQVGAILYPSSKRALSRWVRRVAPTATWAGAGIPLNAVAPGIVRTPMVEELIATEEGRAGLEAAVPMPLHGYLEAQQVAALIAWLVSPENTHLCGQTVYVDGGSDVVLRGEDVWSWNDPPSTVSTPHDEARESQPASS
ncbi:SDR family oxidoreductase [Phycicoccus endophyticus]|uniref:SDR family oxidoreductase n=1 Tax=Phycicoccus endophyticus TaxID=1690220 RepID=A0A7G9R230_9MICO|nr:SDR family oxidoreductase [Phycicoccus endophyticus]NHI19701.1 SDR family oxidoreductase [Phycicoccus endophyticus]QNN49655.1 SDR family oxidoreductase [Phycicoccus endophyticus]GGL33701.1 short-chain dehydrogenase [Phycicoccus endophyticus]